LLRPDASIKEACLHSKSAYTVHIAS
jgi:hypothetical protein